MVLLDGGVGICSRRKRIRTHDLLLVVWGVAVDVYEVNL